jgi:hypothetical protein
LKNCPNGIVSCEEIWYNDFISLLCKGLPAVFRGMKEDLQSRASFFVSHLTRHEKGQIETLQEHHYDAALYNNPSFPIHELDEGNNAF